VAALSHPNLLTIYDVGAAPDGAPFLVCELLEGETLRARLAEGAIPVRQALVWSAQLAHGLAAAHAKGIVHRDLKPENIFCCRDGPAKILDFGLAKFSAAGLGDDQTLPAAADTAAGVVLGTVSYMSPEQARGQAADARSDIFSLGAVIYEMLAGRRAFGRGSAADTLSAILKEEPPELSLANSPLAAPISRILRHCLEKQPLRRFQAAEDLAFALEDLGEATSTTSLQAVATPANRRRWLFAAGGTLGLIAAVAATWWLAASRQHPPVEYQRLTYQQTSLAQARFLPDGRSILGMTQDAAVPQPYSPITVRVDAPGSQPFPVAFDHLWAISGSQAAVALHWHTILAYESAGTLALMPLDGGAPRPLLDNVEAADFFPGSSDAAHLLIACYLPASRPSTLEYPVGNVLFRTGGWVGDPRFSRDGTRIAFLNHPMTGDDNGEVAVVDLAGRTRTLGPHFAASQGMAWSPDGREIWYSGGNTIQSRIWAVTLSGRNRLLLAAPSGLHLEDVLPSGQVLVSSQDQRETMMAVTPDHPRPRDFSVLDWPDQGAVSADGKTFLVGDEDSGPNYSTYLRAADASPPVRLGDGDPLDLSPDGRWALSAVPSATVQLWLLPTGAGTPRQLTHGDIAWVRGRFLPDGTSIFAFGNPPGQPMRTYLLDWNGNPRPIAPPGMLGFAATPDSKWILARDGPHAALLPAAGGAPRPVLPAADWRTITPLRLLDDRTLLAELPAADGARPVIRLDLATGARTNLFVVPNQGPGTSELGLWGITADARTYLFKYTTHRDTYFLLTGLR